MSTILDFYQGRGTDARGRTFHDLLQETDRFWEDCHNHVQILFPLPEPSRSQPGSPVATLDEFNAIASSPILKMRVLAALGRYIAFLDRTTQWRQARDHNHLRITRVLRCLCFCGLNDAAFEFCEYVKFIAGRAVGKETVWYWEEALKRHPAWLQKTEREETEDRVEQMFRKAGFGRAVDISTWPEAARAYLWGGSLVDKLLSMPDTMLNAALVEVGVETTGDHLVRLERLIQRMAPLSDED